jgi:importin subunit beta-1
LHSSDVKAGITAAQVVAAVSEIDIPRNEWPDLMNILIANVSVDNKNLRQATLQAIGFICESTHPDALVAQANAILTAVAQGARKEEPEVSVRLAAIQSLYNALEFIRGNFEKEGERNYIMQIVCEATQCQDAGVQVAAFQCLVRIMSLYYGQMAMYMERALFGLTMAGMKSDNVQVALQAIEFWSTVCEEEIDLAVEEQEMIEAGETPELPNYHFADAAAGELIPVLLYLLTKKEDEEEEDEWNAYMASATCLGLLASAVGDKIVAPVIQFVEANISNPDWRYREAAVMAFGSILEGPTRKLLGPMCTTALRFLCDMVNDQVVAVKDTTAWTLGRICEILAEYIPPADLPRVIQALMQGLNDNVRVASNCAWVSSNSVFVISRPSSILLKPLVLS